MDQAVKPDQLQGLSTRPGVYLLRGARSEILYIGKAKSLRARVRSYFRPDGARSPLTEELARRVRSVETIVVDSEAEALILEANLIKEHRPRFNVQLRDDKRYPYIKVTVGEPFPRIYVTRRVANDGSRYFGPYTSVGLMRQALQVVKRLYTVRSCRYDLPSEAPQRPCLDYHIGRCLAPCVGLQEQADYRAMIEEVLEVLGGDTERVRREVEQRMREAAAALDFERAAHLRDVLQGVDTLARDQRVQRLGGGDQDIVGMARDGDLGVAVVLRIRGGLLLGRETLRLSGIRDEEDSALLAGAAARFYLAGGRQRPERLPREVLLPGDFPDRSLLEEILSSKGGRRIRVRVPRRGDKLRLVELASANARHAMEDRVAALAYSADRADDALYELQDRLDLKVVPRLIVCFDVSHIQGSETVASAVVFENGEPKRAGYRRMRIRGEWGNDDFRSMNEAVTRYFRRRLEDGGPLPDLVVLDGGKSQLRAGREALEGLGVRGPLLVALAKREEEVFLHGRAEPLRLERRDRALQLLQRIRNEAHRFAVGYNRKLRSRRTLASELGRIPGIGPVRQRALLRRFGSVQAVRTATPDEIARTPGFSRILASRILTYLGR